MLDVEAETMPRQTPRLQLLRRLLLAAGLAELTVGLMHFVMPVYYRRSPGLAGLGGDEDAYVALVTYAVGILLIAFAALTLSFARTPGEHLEVLVPYLMVKSVLWAARLGLELVYPVRLEMFGIEPFTAVVLPGVAIVLAVFVAAGYLARQLRPAELL